MIMEACSPSRAVKRSPLKISLEKIKEPAMNLVISPKPRLIIGHPLRDNGTGSNVDCNNSPYPRVSKQL